MRGPLLVVLFASVGASASMILASSALAQVDIATGLNALGVLQTAGGAVDANWTVTGAANPLNPPYAYVVAPGDIDGSFPPWIFNGPNSSWIAANPFDGSGNGDMTFTLEFNVPDPSVAAIAGGSWTIDDAGTLSLNGNVLAQLDDAHNPQAPLAWWSGLNPFSVDPSDFVAGLNVLTMQVRDSDYWSEGGRLEGTLLGGTILSPPPPTTIPEAPAWLMLIAGFAGLGAIAWSRKGRSSDRQAASA